MRKYFCILLFYISICQTFGQEYYTELNGFKIGQFREVAKNELGKPHKIGKYEDGFEYEIFLLKPDPSLYMIFEYAVNKTDMIWSIQITGTNSTVKTGFKNLKFGIPKSKIEQILGKATSKENIEGYGIKWDYDQSNFSVEVNEGKLSSIKITDRSEEMFKSGKLPRMPTFEEIQKIFSSNNNGEMLKIFAPDVEIYHDKKIYSFSKSFKTEQITDNSKIFAKIREISKDLKAVNVKNLSEYEENMRVTLGDNPKHVIKIKKGHIIKEIVLKRYGKEFLIYEIDAESN